MIFDEIKNIGIYNLPEEAVQFIKSLTPEIECGRHVLSDDVYASINEYSTKDFENCFFEAHNNYIDIQILLKGVERLDFTAVEGLEIKDAYDEKRDILFFKDEERDVHSIKLEKGVFVVLYPHEAHKPQMNFNEVHPVKKVVVKIKVK